jgi:hypothetical protein
MMIAQNSSDHHSYNEHEATLSTRSTARSDYTNESPPNSSRIISAPSSSRLMEDSPRCNMPSITEVSDEDNLSDSSDSEWGIESDVEFSMGDDIDVSNVFEYDMNVVESANNLSLVVESPRDEIYEILLNKDFVESPKSVSHAESIMETCDWWDEKEDNNDFLIPSIDKMTSIDKLNCINFNINRKTFYQSNRTPKGSPSQFSPQYKMQCGRMFSPKF